VSFLPEYALLPEVLDACDAGTNGRLRSLFYLFLQDGLVRNLHSGRWRQIMVQKMAALSPPSREVLEFLLKSKRLRSCPKGLHVPPESSTDWCKEAIASHKHRKLEAVFAERPTVAQFPEQPLVVATDDPFERGDIGADQSAELRFHIDDYREYLTPLIKVAGEICFIDPYINPDHAQYRHGFLEILRLAADNANQPRIEIHRMSEVEPRRGSQAARELCSEKEWWPIFADWHHQLVAWRLKVDVHIWSKFGSRYFLTNYVGLSAGKGFKSDPMKKERHHWSLLKKEHRDSVRGDFDSLGNSPTYERRCQFSIGAA